MTRHVIPADEAELHTHDDQCPCGPVAHPHARNTISHQPLTGAEQEVDGDAPAGR